VAGQRAAAERWIERRTGGYGSVGVPPPNVNAAASR
jgi:hypothetical protein